jgi:hypothetical protein
MEKSILITRQPVLHRSVLLVNTQENGITVRSANQVEYCNKIKRKAEIDNLPATPVQCLVGATEISASAATTAATAAASATFKNCFCGDTSRVYFPFPDHILGCGRGSFFRCRGCDGSSANRCCSDEKFAPADLRFFSFLIHSLAPRVIDKCFCPITNKRK